MREAMSEADHPVNAAPPAVGGGFVNHRREAKDTLLGDEPPRILGAAIITIALALATLVVAAQAIEYEDAVPVTLTLQAAAAPESLCGVAYLKPEEALRVKRGQPVRIDWHVAGVPAFFNKGAAASVSDLSPIADGGLYAVRVTLAADPEGSAGDGLAAKSWPPTPARIITQRVKLFGKLFGVFRAVFGRH
jgi:hypothetical protein